MVRIGIVLFWIACFCCLTWLQAQPRVEGYIVLNAGDTLTGEIKKPSALFLLHHQVSFWPDDDKTLYKFEPDELRAFGIGGQEFISHYIWSGNALVKKFLKPVVTGYCTLYAYRHTHQNQRGMVSEPVLTYFIERQDERLHVLDFTKLKKGEDLYFADNPIVQREILKGKYSKRTAKELVERYNGLVGGKG